MADAHLQAGETEQAIDLLESLYEASPRNSSFYRKLKEAYESVKRYDEAVELVEDRIGNRPTPTLLSEKARLLYQKGAEDEARTTWNEALTLFPDEPTTYRVVYQSLVESRRFKQAIDVLKEAREVLEDDSLFRTELAYLYGLDGRHEEAMSEYVEMLDQSPDQINLVRRRLQSFVEQGEGVSASIERLETAVENHPLNPSYRELLAWLLMKTDDYEAAYTVHRALDRQQQAEGETLFSFAREAADADRYAVATKAYQAILEHHAEAEVAPRAQRALGDAYRKWASTEDGGSLSPPDSSSRYAASRQAYASFLDQYPDHEAVPEVLAALGTLQLDVYRNLEAARSTLETVVNSHANTEAAGEARYELGRISLLQGHYDQARRRFSRLAEDLRGDELGDRARFELARLQYYRGAFDAALALTDSVSATPSSDVTNDAIELRVLINENQGPDSLNTPLRLYAQAELRSRQHRYDDALTHLDSLLQSHERHPLADEARFQQARVHLAREDTTSALETYRAFPRTHPRSPYADRSLFRLGELYEAQNRTDTAIETYDRLLSDYPNSLLASDVRSRLRALRRSRG